MKIEFTSKIKDLFGADESGIKDMAEKVFNGLDNKNIQFFFFTYRDQDLFCKIDDDTIIIGLSKRNIYD